MILNNLSFPVISSYFFIFCRLLGIFWKCARIGEYLSIISLLSYAVNCWPVIVKQIKMSVFKAQTSQLCTFLQYFIEFHITLFLTLFKMVSHTPSNIH